MERSKAIKHCSVLKRRQCTVSVATSWLQGKKWLHLSTYLFIYLNVMLPDWSDWQYRIIANSCYFNKSIRYKNVNFFNAASKNVLLEFRMYSDKQTGGSNSQISVRTIRRMFEQSDDRMACSLSSHGNL